MAIENKNNVIAKQTVIANAVKQSANKKEIASTKKLRNDVRVPKLRFKEFDDDWEQKKLGTIFKINAGGDINKSHVSNFKTEKYKYPIYANAEKNKGFYAYSDIYKAEKETITVAGRGVNIGIAHARNHKFYPIVRLLVLIPKKNENIYFFEYQINRINLFKESTGVPQLTAPQISGYQVAFPILQEQQKIASFLTSVDTKIQQLTTKKKYLENYKKGVMQQLFSQQLRFKNDDGLDFPDWEEKKLGEIATKKSSNISANTIEENFGDYKLYGASGYIKSIDFYREKENFISIVKDGAGVGRTLLCESKSSVLGTLDIIQPKIKVNLYFLYSVLNNIQFKKYTIGSTIPHIYFKDYSKEKIKIPSLKEQQKIANYLSAIDDKIENVQTQIEKTQAFKKGLLQQMFV